MEIPVNVGDDGHSHGSRTLAKRAGLIALAVVWVVSGFFLWRTSVPRLDIPDLDPRDYFSAAELAKADEYRRKAEEAEGMAERAANASTREIYKDVAKKW